MGEPKFQSHRIPFPSEASAQRPPTATPLANPRPSMTGFDIYCAVLSCGMWPVWITFAILEYIGKKRGWKCYQ